MRIVLFSLFSGLVFFLSSCSDNTVFKSEFLFPQESWASLDSVIFDFEISDTIQPHQFLVDIEHSNEYSYENLYMKVTTEFPNGKSVIDIMAIQFSDKMGQWIGHCGKNSCELEVLMQENFYFQSKGSYRLIFEQYSREDTLNGISSLQIRVLESK